MTMDSRSFMLQMYGLHSVPTGALWTRSIGLEYWHVFGPGSQGASSAHALADNGWTVTGAPPDVAESGADFLDPADYGTTGGVHLDTAADVIQSPALFGSAAHADLVAALVGSQDLPTLLVLDWWGRFSANNNETATGVGFVEDGGSAAVANDHMAAIAVDGTDFVLRSGAASVKLVTDDTNFHHFRIKCDKATGLATAYVDDMSAELGTIALQADEWPAAVGGGVLTATGANDPVIKAFRVRYGWHHLGI